MTSVLYGSGLNYQGSNPLRSEIRQIQASISDLRKLIEGVDARVSRSETAINRLTERSNQVVEALNSIRSGSGAAPLPTVAAPIAAPVPVPVPVVVPVSTPPIVAISELVALA